MLILSMSCGCGSSEPTSVNTEGTAGNAENISQDESSEPFYITEITDEIFDRIYGRSFKEDCTVQREDLRYLHILHKDLDGNEHEGEMIVNKLYNPYTKTVDGERIIEPVNGEPYPENQS